MANMEHKMNRYLRQVFLQALKDGTPEERRGELTRDRFNKAVCLSMKCKNSKRNTDGYWATAQTMGFDQHPQGQLVGQQSIATFSKAVVNPDVWARDGFVLETQDLMSETVKVELVGRRKRRRMGSLTAEEMM